MMGTFSNGKTGNFTVTAESSSASGKKLELAFILALNLSTKGESTSSICPIISIINIFIFVTFLLCPWLMQK